MRELCLNVQAIVIVKLAFELTKRIKKQVTEKQEQQTTRNERKLNKNNKNKNELAN